MMMLVDRSSIYRLIAKSSIIHAYTNTRFVVYVFTYFPSSNVILLQILIRMRACLNYFLKVQHLCEDLNAQDKYISHGACFISLYIISTISNDFKIIGR